MVDTPIGLTEGSFGGSSFGPDVDPAVGGETVDRGKLVNGKRKLAEGPEVLFELCDAAGADQRGGDSRVSKGPGQRHLREGLATLLCDRVEAADLGQAVFAEHFRRQ